jgi:hypothetical protein
MPSTLSSIIARSSSLRSVPAKVVEAPAAGKTVGLRTDAVVATGFLRTTRRWLRLSVVRIFEKEHHLR